MPFELNLRVMEMFIQRQVVEKGRTTFNVNAEKVLTLIQAAKAFMEIRDEMSLVGCETNGTYMKPETKLKRIQKILDEYNDVELSD